MSLFRTGEFVRTISKINFGTPQMRLFVAQILYSPVLFLAVIPCAVCVIETEFSPSLNRFCMYSGLCRGAP